MRLLRSYRPWRTAACKPHPSASGTSLRTAQLWLLCSALLPGLVQEPALVGKDPDTQLQPAREGVLVVRLCRGVWEGWSQHEWQIVVPSCISPCRLLQKVK